MNEVPMKRCSKCKREFPATPEYFKARNDSPDGLRHQCKECTGGQFGIFHKRSITVNGLRQCTSCDEWKPATTEYFYRDKTKQGGLSTRCSVCALEMKLKSQHSADYDQWKTRRDEADVLKRQGLKRCCSGERCITPGGPWLPATTEYFTVQRSAVDGLSWHCRNCQHSRMKHLRTTHPQIYTAASRRAYQKRRSNPFKRDADNKKSRLSVSKRRTNKMKLPYSFTTEDWQRCLDYWDHRCAICGQPVGLWHTLAQDHWIPLSDDRPDNPGTVPWNMLPLCHNRKDAPVGTPSCNLAKGAKDPVQWLVDKLGKRKAKKKLAEIEAYFEWVKQQGGD